MVRAMANINQTNISRMWCKTLGNRCSKKERTEIKSKKDLLPWLLRAIGEKVMKYIENVGI